MCKAKFFFLNSKRIHCASVITHNNIDFTQYALLGYCKHYIVTIIVRYDFILGVHDAFRTGRDNNNRITHTVDRIRRILSSKTL